MIWHVLLGIWLIPAGLGLIAIPIADMVSKRHFKFWDEPSDVVIMFFFILIWPTLILLAIHEHRMDRKKRLKEVAETIEVHYRDKWYD